jgi:signal transduction histidine kinase
MFIMVMATGRARAMRLVRQRTAQLRGAQAQLVDTARQAGMAEIATNVLHNVGNVLNSVNVSADLVREKVRGSKSPGLSKAVALMQEHADDLGDFFATDAKGKALPEYLATLAGVLANERQTIEEELLRLTKGVTHIKQIVAAQQLVAGTSSVIEPVRISELFDDATRMAGVLDDEVTVIREVGNDPMLAMDRHRLLLILLNLVSNALLAMENNLDRPRALRLTGEVSDEHAVKITVADNGVGIQAADFTRIFVHGYTTRNDGHGFGLHSSALAAKEMGGDLTVNSDGVGTGAIFTLQVPLQVPAGRESAPL